MTRVRQPEYTGENRCLPCTIVNTIIAVVLAGVVAAVGFIMSTPIVALASAGAVLAVALLSIYFRGYLVPGTPALTKRYGPSWFLAFFGKEPLLERHESLGTGDADIDPETALISAGALEECEDDDDLCLTDRFREAWQAELDAVDSETGRDHLLELLDIDVGEVEYEEFGSAFRARVDGTIVGKWESKAAFLADLAAARVFAAHYPGWEQLPVTTRGQLLNGLRLFVDTCPNCGGVPSFGAETVTSCCSTYEVAAVACRNCDARLFETPVEP